MSEQVQTQIQDANVWNQGLEIACRNGFLKSAKSLISNGADCFNSGLFNACKHGKLN